MAEAKEGYWKLSSEELFSKFETSLEGLKVSEAKARLEKYGLNEIESGKKSWLKIFSSQFTSPLILVLVASAIIAMFVGDATDSLIIIAIVFVNGLLGFFQEYKSEQAIEKLKKYISFYAKVVRGDNKVEIDSKEVVPGDIITLEIGDKVPADIRLVNTNNISINESILTGEPYPVSKNEKVLSKDNLTVQEIKNMAFMGTVVAEGQGIGIVVKTGKSTEFGKTVSLLKGIETEGDFQKNITKFGKTLTNIILALITIIFLLNTILGKSFLDSFMFAIALAVGIVPESLPIVITVSLSRAALQLAKKKVVVKKLAAIEDVGNVDVLCTDKTGTMTENKITLEHFVGIDKKSSRDILEYGLICNSAVRSGKGEFKGNPVDASIHEYAKAHSIHVLGHSNISVLPFDFNRRLMSVLIKKDKKHYQITKGAVENLVKISTKIIIGKKLLPIAGYKRKITEVYNEFVNKGYKVIGVSVKDVKKAKALTRKDESGLTFVGFLVFIDPPKKSAKASVQKAKELGVSIRILTGDDPLTTAAIAKSIGLELGTDSIITGDEIEKMDDAKLQKVAEKKIIFARVNPEHKFRIIKALRANNHVVGYIGDGINDAPALKEADVGISVDTGADVAKDASDIVLLEQDLGVIIEGIREGRKTFSNIMKYIVNTISANFGNMGTLGFISPFLKFLPLLPSQILLNNFLTDTPMIAISTDNVDEAELKRPKKWNISHITKLCAFLGGISTIFDFATIAVLIYMLQANAALFRTGWFIESGLSEIIIAFAVRSKGFFLRSVRPSKIFLWASVGTIVLTLAIVYSPIGKFFQFVHLPLWLIGAIVLILCGYFVLTESVLLIYYKYFYKED